MNCRHCKNVLEYSFLDLGFSPPSNAYLGQQDLKKPEIYFPLKLYVCTFCWLVQTEDYAGADELFSPDYAYFSSISATWLKHAVDYVSMITDRLSLDKNSYVIEIASNDGYLLKNFSPLNIPCLGIEPTTSTAQTAINAGIPTLQKFFSKDLGHYLAAEGKQADLIIGNNVYAHVPDINDFTAGMAIALKPEGTITLEFPHLMRLLDENQFDTIYHEHYSYLSLHTVGRIFAAHGLRIYDVEQLSTHGGSLRVYGCHKNSSYQVSSTVQKTLNIEKEEGLLSLATYSAFQAKADRIKNDFLSFLLQAKHQGKTVAGYGAAAKGNTLLNYAGIKPDLVSFTCDAAPSKQGKYLPGSHIPILPPSALIEKKPHYVVIFPWNIADEVMGQQGYISSWGGQFVTVIPYLRTRA